MQVVIDDHYENIIRTELPVLPDGMSFKSFYDDHQKLSLDQAVKDINMEWLSAPSDSFMNAVPDRKEISNKLNINSPHLMLHLEAECFMQKIVAVQFEHSDLPVSRKTSGFIFLKTSIVEAMLERTENILEEEYQNRFNLSANASQIRKEIRSRIRTLESTPIARYFHLYEALLELRSKVKEMEMTGITNHQQVLERRMWKQLELKSGNYEIKNKLNLPDSGEKSSDMNRRAADSKVWEEYKKKGIDDTDKMHWQQTCRALGAFFTARILLRKELFHEILDLIEMDICIPEDLSRILADCSLVLEKLEKAAADEEKITILRKIVSRLNDTVYR